MNDERERGPHWNEQLQSWEYPYSDSLERTIVEFLADPTEDRRKRYEDALTREIEETRILLGLGEGNAR